MSGIVWLASYPKSGNTWLRVFLANLSAGAESPYDINALREFGYSDSRASLYERVSGQPFEALSMQRIHQLRPAVHKFIASRRPGLVYVKTHNAIAVHDSVPTISPEVTKGAVYLIRNPLDVAVSYAHHFALPIEEVIAAMAEAGNTLPTAGRSAFSYLGSWSQHVRSWTEAPGLNAHVVRYEDMLDTPTAAFRSIARYLRLEVSRNALKRAIRYSSFSELRRQESQHGFRERGPAGNEFFRLGRAGAWREILQPAQIAALSAAHAEIMQRYGYLP